MQNVVVRIHPVSSDALFPVLSHFKWSIWGFWTVKAAFFHDFLTLFSFISRTDEQLTVVWSIKCHEMLKNVVQCFPKSKVLSFLYDYIEFTVLEKSRNQKTFTFKRSWNQRILTFLL